MNKFLKKTVNYLFLIFIIYLLTFILIRTIPGDPIDFLIGQNNQVVDIDALKKSLGLDLSFFQQLKLAIFNLLQLNFGVSIYQGAEVYDLLIPSLINTYQLALFSISVAILIGVPLGLAASFFKKSLFNKVLNFCVPILLALPSFILAPILILIFSLTFHLLPVNGMDSKLSIILPGLTLSLGLMAYLAKMTEDCVGDILDSQVIICLRAKGLSEIKIYMTHILRLITLPLITVIGLQMGSLLSGAIITEMIFSWDGVGKLLIDSIHQRDYPITQAAVFFISLSYVTINYLLEFLYPLLDSRVKYND